MVTITGKYEGPHKCTMRHGPSRTELSTDAPVDNGGTGSLFSPTDLLATSYASCMMTIMSLHAEKNGFSVDGSTFQIDKHMSSDQPRRVERLVCQFILPATIAESQRESLVQAARTCPVALSVSKELQVDASFSFEATDV